MLRPSVTGGGDSAFLSQLLDLPVDLPLAVRSSALLPPSFGADQPPAVLVLLLVALLLAIVVIAFRLRLLDLRRRGRQLEDLVASRTRDLERKVEELEQIQSEAEAARHKLDSAEERLEELRRGPSPETPHLHQWLQPIGRELATTLDLRWLDLWAFRDGRLVPMGNAPPLGAAPDLERLRRAVAESRWEKEGNRTIVPVLGLSNRLTGALALGGAHPEWQPEERRLVEDFARHVGSVLEMQRTRRRLHELETARTSTRRELLASGHGILRVCPRCENCFDEHQATCPQDGVELAPQRRMLPYRIGGRYRLTRVLARGAVGTVFVATDEQLHRNVAVKILNQQHFRSEQSRIRFEKECLAVARIRHRGVVTLYDSGLLPDSSPFLVMELLDGVDLGRMMSQWGPGRPDQVARLVRQGGSALEAAHLGGLIHRDIKPQNLFLAWREKGFRTKILDFGLAKNYRDEGSMTQSGLVVGTPTYMSPEQIRELPLGPRSDLYSFATVCYYALTGQRTVEATEVVDIFSEVVDRIPPPVSHYLPGTPAVVDAAFAAALAKDPDDRPASAKGWSAISRSIAEIPGRGPGWSPDEIPKVVARRRARDPELPPTLVG